MTVYDCPVSMLVWVETEDGAALSPDLMLDGSLMKCGWAVQAGVKSGL